MPFAQIALPGGETPAVVRAIADSVHDGLEDVMIVRAENGDLDWSFGNGEAQYAK
jgi:hypothetical protein